MTPDIGSVSGVEPYDVEMDTWEAVTSRRQVRSFSDAPLEDADVRRILESGRRAPSAHNSQPWDFVVVSDQARLERLSGVWPGAVWIPGSAVTIALVVPMATDERQRMLDRFDLGQAAMQMMVTATGLGIGSGQAHCENQDVAREVLGLPADRACGLLIALGHPADGPLRPLRDLNRRDFDDVVHWSNW